jgi:hypothetical protein
MHVRPMQKRRMSPNSRETMVYLDRGDLAARRVAMTMRDSSERAGDWRVGARESRDATKPVALLSAA